MRECSANERRRIAGGEKREPTIRIASAPAPRPEDLAPGEEGVEDRVREPGAHAHQAPELLLADDQHAAVLDDAAGQEPALACQQVQLAGEAAPPVARDHVGLVAVRPDDLGTAGEDHEQVVGGLAGFEQHLAGSDRALAVPNSAISPSCASVSVAKAVASRSSSALIGPPLMVLAGGWRGIDRRRCSIAATNLAAADRLSTWMSQTR